MACIFPRQIGAVLSIAADERLRLVLIANLLEEEGIVASEHGAGLRRDRARSHVSLAARLALAAGASREDLDRTAQMASAGRWFEAAIRRSDWIGAFAYFAVGHEANVPRTFGPIAAALTRYYGLSEADVEFLTEHCVADERHGTESADLIAELATTPHLRSAALEGAGRGGRAWYAFHRRWSAGAAGRVR